MNGSMITTRGKGVREIVAIRVIVRLKLLGERKRTENGKRVWRCSGKRNVCISRKRLMRRQGGAKRTRKDMKRQFDQRGLGDEKESVLY